MLTRMGNKSSIAKKIYSHFPSHKMRIELFFGAGGSFFNMPPAKYNILNDIDDDVVNLYELVVADRQRLIEEIERLPIASSLLKKWKKETPIDPVQKALRFLLLSNFTYLGKGDTLRLGLDNSKEILLSKIDLVFKKLQNSKITNYDFREVIQKISFTNGLLTKADAFVYLDPVYLDTEHFYKCPKWLEKDTLDCFDIMSHSGIKCAMSEFDHPLILDQSRERGFHIIPIKSRQNIKNRRREILVTNYEPCNIQTTII